MPNFFDDLLDRFCELHADIRKAIEALPREALDWVPGTETNSVAVLVMHLTGAENYWVGVAINDPPARDREMEFTANGFSKEDLIAHLDSADEHIRQVLAGFRLPDLEVNRQSPRNSREFTAGWCLVHALEHTALHTGHVQLTQQLWEKKNN